MARACAQESDDGGAARARSSRTQDGGGVQTRSVVGVRRQQCESVANDGGDGG